MNTSTPDLETQAQELLQQPLLARLATVSPQTLQPHVVPVWFWWDGTSLWISAFSSTRKVKDLRQNPKCAVLIEPIQSQATLQAVLFEGTAELITEPREQVAAVALQIYTRYMGAEGVLAPEPQSWLTDPENTLIKLTGARRLLF